MKIWLKGFPNTIFVFPNTMPMMSYVTFKIFHLYISKSYFSKSTERNEMKHMSSESPCFELQNHTPVYLFKASITKYSKKNKYSAAKPCFPTLNLIISITKTWFNKRRHGFVAWSFLNRMTWVPILSSNQILKSNSPNFGYKSVFWEKHSSQQINFL